MFKRYLKYYWTFIKFSAKLETAYKLNFWISFFTDFTMYFIQIVAFSAIFLNVDTINGWNINHMIFFLGTFMIIDSLCMMTYFFGVLGIPSDIQTGRLDIFITKPINTLFYVSTRHFEFGAIFNVLLGISLVTYGASNLDISITLYKIIGYIILVIIMYFLLYSLIVIVRTVAFHVIKIDALMELEDELIYFAFRIPGVVFTGISKFIFFVILPYGLIATVPTTFFTQTLEFKHLIISLVVAGTFYFICRNAWKLGLKKYSSASS